jgi:large subunit ribosomal protein L15
VKLNEIKPAKGSRKRRKRIGFGPGSGHGKTSTMGMKGQNARSKSNKVGFEGGQMPLIRRTPKRGFTNIFKKEYAVINVSDLNIFNEGETISLAMLKDKKLIPEKSKKYKILGDGELKKKIIVIANLCSKKALEKIKALSGEVKLNA